MRAMKTITAGVLLATVAVQASSMEMTLSDGVLRASGKVVREDIDQFGRLVSSARVVVLADSKGGDLKAGYDIAEKIRAGQLTTLVEGVCASSCAVMFMGGTKRQFSANADLSKTTLRFHGPHKKQTKEVSEKGAPKLYDWLMAMSGNRFSPEVLKRAMYISDEHDMMWFYHPSIQLSGTATWFCPNGTRNKPQQCDPIADADALSQGVVTELTLGDAKAIAQAGSGQ